MVNQLEAHMSRADIAASIGVEPQEVEEIASGFVPDEEVGERLRELVASGRRGRRMRVPVWAVVAFVVVDTVVFAIVAVVLLVR